jgi:hypothetical protein
MICIGGTVLGVVGANFGAQAGMNLLSRGVVVAIAIISGFLT